MSDREKGLLKALNEIVLNAIYSYYCQHITDNV